MFSHERVLQDFQQRSLFLNDPSNAKAFALMIDHTLLKMSADESHYIEIISQAVEHHFRSICIPSCRVELASHRLDQMNADSHLPLICTVIGFPNGYSLTECKVAEVIASEKHGANEFDYVQNIGWVKEGHWQRLEEEANALVNAAQDDLVKVILETSLLSEEEIFQSALAAARGGVHVLKTSTGFGARGASLRDIEILNRVVDMIQTEKGYTLGIKASGGIRNMQDAANLIKTGASRLGASAGIDLLAELHAAHSHPPTETKIQENEDKY
jgi:deoxyribose-phosphate aldolase